MKYLKRIGWGLLAMIIILLVLAFVLPTKVEVQQSHTFNAPKNMVYNIVSNLETWKEWGDWQQMDETMSIEYGEKTVGKGASYSWTSEKMGDGIMTIVAADPNHALDFEMNFGDRGDGIARWTFEGEENTSSVNWSFETKMGRPMNLMAFMMKRGLKKNFRKGFKNIEKMVKDRIENKIYAGYKINEVDMPVRSFVMNRQEIPMSDVNKFYTQNLGPLFIKVQQAKMEMDGMPCGLFFTWDGLSKKTDMAAAIPVKEAKSIKGAASYTLKGGQAVQVDYYGDYHGLSKAHDAIESYLSDYGLVYDPPVIEEYLTDPGEEKDPSKWLTKVTYYLGAME